MANFANLCQSTASIQHTPSLAPSGKAERPKAYFFIRTSLFWPAVILDHRGGCHSVRLLVQKKKDRREEGRCPGASTFTWSSFTCSLWVARWPS